METLSNRLRQLRKDIKKTQAEVSKDISIPRSTLAQYETGQRNPDLSTLRIFAEYYRVTTDYLLGNELDKIQVLIGKLKDNTIKRSIKWYCLGDKTAPQYIVIGSPADFDEQKSYYCGVGSFYYALLWVYDEKYVLHCAYPKKYADMDQFPFDESSNVKNTEMDFFIYTGSDEKNNALDDLASIVKERIKETGTVNDSLLTDMISALDNLE